MIGDAWDLAVEALEPFEDSTEEQAIELAEVINQAIARYVRKQGFKQPETED